MSACPLETVRADDFIEYFLFPDPESVAQAQPNDGLTNVLQQIEAISQKYCAHYIWHKDAFRLSARCSASSNLLLENQSDQNNSEDDELPPHLYGITFYEDNVQDEWFIVSLLFEITRQIPGLIARVVDSDGEFILIEAAEHLPQWANPDTCEQRVYIHNGQLHLVQNSPSSTTTILPVAVALTKIRSNPTLYRVSKDITSCIQERTRMYPDRISEGLHRTKCFVPISAAILLRQKPQLISAVVRSFCSRDVVDNKVCRAMKHFPPENRVMISVTFTKCLYAMLTHTSFIPDRRIGWNLPAPNSEQYKSHLLGIKLACGFEILASQAKTQETLDTSKGWLAYLESLTKKGYFQHFIENSKDHSRLLKAAKAYYRENVDGSSIASQVGAEMLTLLKQSDCSVDDFKKDEDKLPADDDENWLNITPEELDNMLMKQYGIKQTINLQNGNFDPAAALAFTENLTEFLDKKSDFEGIDNSVLQTGPVAPKRGVKKGVKLPDVAADANESTAAASNNIDFNPDLFQTHLKEMLDLIIPEDNWESTSDMSDFDDDEDLTRNIDGMADSKAQFNEYYAQMDKELAKTTIGKSFEGQKAETAAEDDFEDIESFKPVNIDANALKNFAHSYQSQFGGPGPASSLLGSMGIRIKAEETADVLYNTQV